MNHRLRASGLLFIVGATLATTLVSTLLAAPVQAQAQRTNDALARNFFESGRAYFDAARYEEAAAAFAEAYRLSHRPQLLVNQARALEAAHRRDEAITVLESAEAELPAAQADLRAEVEARLNRLRAERDREQQETAARVAAEEAARAREAASALAPTSATARATSTAPRKGRFLIGVSAGGLAVASLAVALGTGLRSSSIEGDLESACPGNVCPPDRSGDPDHGQRLARTSTAFTFIGIASAAVAIPFLLLGIRDRKHAASDAPSVSLTGGPGDVGIGIDARF